MEYKYSTLVDPSSYETLGLCDTIPLRVHKNAHLADRGSRQAQADWRKLVGKVENFTGCMGPRFNGIAVAVPECRPERLEVIAYSNEFAFLHDDVTDTVSQEKSDAENNEMTDGFRAGAQAGAMQSSSGKSQMQAKLILRLLSIDRERAVVLMKSWEGLVGGASGRQHSSHFASLDEYLPYRIVDVGQTFWFGILTFAMAITISEEETELSKEITRPAFVTLGLTNDFFSWQKEYDEFLQNEKADSMANAVWILMHEHSITVEEAKDLCKKKIGDSCKEYRRLKKQYESTHKLSPDLRKYLSALELSISGNVVWSQTSPRYNFQKPRDEQKKLQKVYNKDAITQLNGHRKGKHPKAASYVCEKCKDHSSIEVKELGNESDVFSSFPSSEADPEELSPSGSEEVGSSESSGVFSTGPKDSVSTVSSTTDQHSKIEDILLNRSLPAMSDDVLLAPYQYLSSLPSKGVRNAAIDALNVWLKIPEGSLKIIKSVIGLLHSSSLMLDDMEDSSPLRRGRPSTHTVFGPAQTINSADYLFVEALNEVRKLNDPKCVNIFSEELRNLYIGQSYDLYWTHNVMCPSIEDYLKMVDNKTGGLFRLLLRLMMARSTKNRSLDLSGLIALVGCYFQIRDDYQNLVSADYTTQKGFCEDLDEGKFSLPLIHALQSDSQNMQLRSILQERRAAGKLTFELKQVVLEQLKRTNSLEYTKMTIKALQDEIDKELEEVERVSGMENYILRLLVERLRV